MREYEVEFMGIDGRDMYDTTILAKDINEAFKLALKKLDRKDDRIISVVEIM